MVSMIVQDLVSGRGSVNAPKRKQPLWFGEVQNKKSYISDHLMPVYVNPGLPTNISPALKKRMHGKSCFNLGAEDPELFDELAVVTDSGFEDYRQRGYV